MTQLLEYGEIKLIDASSAPFRVPPHYQLVTSSSALPLEPIDSLRLNSSSPLKPSAIKTEPTTLIKPQPTPTDFENLIEMNARCKQNLDSTADIAAATATANKMIKFEPKTIANTAVVSSSPGNMVISSTSASPFSSLKASQNGGILKIKPSVQQMDVDVETSTISPNPNHLPSPKYALGMDNKLINKVKIVVDNMNGTGSIGGGGGGVGAKHRLDLDASGYHLMPHPHASLMAAAAAAQQAAFPGYNFHSSFHLYEYSQNNQNFLNQHRVDAEHHNAIDDSMWRPW